MKSVKYSLLLVSLFFFTELVRSQDAVKVLDKVYGLDQTLYNGKKYSYAPAPGTKGHQYLSTPAYVDGSVTLKGKCFNDIDLNYDIFNQQLLLKYNDETGALVIIEISRAWLTTFRIGNMNFEYLNLENSPRFFQVFGEGKVRILYYWRKNQDVDGTIGTYFLAFSRPVKDSYVLMNGILKPYNTKRSFVRIFNPAQRPEIKSYLRKHKIKVNKASDQTITEMITFIANIK
jgi:hypothetical protein